MFELVERDIAFRCLDPFPEQRGTKSVDPTRSEKLPTQQERTSLVNVGRKRRFDGDYGTEGENDLRGWKTKISEGDFARKLGLRAYDSKRMVSSRMSSWTGKDGPDKVFGSHPNTIHGLSISLR